MKKFSVKEVVGFLFSLLLAGLFLYFAFAGVDLSNLFELIKTASIFWIIIFLILTLLGHYVRALRWKVVLESVKKDVSTTHLFGALLLGYGVSSAVPRLGEVSRAVSIGQVEGISKSSVFGTIIVERVIDILFFGLAVVVSGFLFGSSIYEKFPWLYATVVFGAVAIAFAIIFLVLVIKLQDKFSEVVVRILSFFSHKLAEKISGIIGKLIIGFSSLSGKKNYGLTLFYSIVLMLVYAITSYVGLFILSMQSNPSINFTSGWIIMSISSIGMMIPTPGGLGSYHTITRSVLEILFGYSAGISIAYATITHGLSFLLHIAGAVIFFLIFKRKLTDANKNIILDLNESSN